MRKTSLPDIINRLVPLEVVLDEESRKPEQASKPEVRRNRDGRIIIRPRNLKEIIECFTRKFKRLEPDQCWTWEAAISSPEDPYGTFWVDSGHVKAHRFSYMLWRGPIPDGYLVCHECDNPICVNPFHLFLGTHKDNVQDCIQKGRDTREIGEDRYCAKLTEDDVRTIRGFYKFRVTPMQKIADDYGVSRSAISNAVHRIRWKHVK